MSAGATYPGVGSAQRPCSATGLAAAHYSRKFTYVSLKEHSCNRCTIHVLSHLIRGGGSAQSTRRPRTPCQRVDVTTAGAPLLVQHAAITDSHVCRRDEFRSHGHCLHRVNDSDVTVLLGSNLHRCDTRARSPPRARILLLLDIDDHTRRHSCARPKSLGSRQRPRRPQPARSSRLRVRLELPVWPANTQHLRRAQYQPVRTAGPPTCPPTVEHTSIAIAVSIRPDREWVRSADA